MLVVNCFRKSVLLVFYCFKELLTLEILLVKLEVRYLSSWWAHGLQAASFWWTKPEECVRLPSL